MSRSELLVKLQSRIIYRLHSSSVVTSAAVPKCPEGCGFCHLICSPVKFGVVWRGKAHCKHTVVGLSASWRAWSTNQKQILQFLFSSTLYSTLRKMIVANHHLDYLYISFLMRRTHIAPICVIAWIACEDFNL